MNYGKTWSLWAPAPPLNANVVKHLAVMVDTEPVDTKEVDPATPEDMVVDPEVDPVVLDQLNSPDQAVVDPLEVDAPIRVVDVATAKPKTPALKAPLDPPAWSVWTVFQVSPAKTESPVKTLKMLRTSQPRAASTAPLDQSVLPELQDALESEECVDPREPLVCPVVMDSQAPPEIWDPPEMPEKMETVEHKEKRDVMPINPLPDTDIEVFPEILDHKDLKVTTAPPEAQAALDPLEMPDHKEPLATPVLTEKKVVLEKKANTAQTPPIAHAPSAVATVESVVETSAPVESMVDLLATNTELAVAAVEVLVVPVDSVVLVVEQVDLVVLVELVLVVELLGVRDMVATVAV